jgi:hypothetical protein
MGLLLFFHRGDGGGGSKTKDNWKKPAERWFGNEKVRIAQKVQVFAYVELLTESQNRRAVAPDSHLDDA